MPAAHWTARADVLVQRRRRRRRRSGPCRCRRSGPAGCHGTRTARARCCGWSVFALPVKRVTASLVTDSRSTDGRSASGIELKRTRATVWTVAGRVVGPRVVVVGAALDERGEVARRRVHAVEELDVLRADRARGRRARGAGEADQRVEERVVALLELGRLADADEAAAVLDVGLQVGFLLGVEHVAGGVDEHDGAIAGEVRRGDLGRVGRDVDRVVAGRAGGLERGGRGGASRGSRVPAVPVKTSTLPASRPLARRRARRDDQRRDERSADAQRSRASRETGGPAAITSPSRLPPPR